jgi:Ca2+-binding EF-hand superfamily protein
VSKFEAMLVDVGVRIERRDTNILFHTFNIVQDGYLNRQEYWTVLALTDFEIDEVVEKIRSTLLRQSSPLGGDGETTTAPTKLRVNSTLREVFRAANANRDGILSVMDTLALCARVGVYVTEEEARKVMKVVDEDGDDRIEEGDFLRSLGHKGDSIVKKAHRLRDAAAALRIWLTRNNKMGLSASINASMYSAALAHQWTELRTRHEKSYGTKFPGYLTPDDILILLLSIGVRVTTAEARELVLIMGPERSGRLQQADLIQFMGSSCRSFGELCALMERDVMKPLIDCYRAYRAGVRENEEHYDLKDEYDNMVRGIVKTVEAANVAESKSGMDVVSVLQVKTGVETFMCGYTTPEDQMPTLEEWTCLCSLTGAVVAGDETFGARLKVFLSGLCAHVAGPLLTGRKGDELSLKQAAAVLQKMLRHEAELAGRAKKRDYKAVFALFDEDGSGTISLKEFRQMLEKLHLIDELTEAQIPALLQMFDHKNRGKVDLEAFTHFSEANQGAASKEEDYDSEEEDKKIGLLSSNPPAAISRNGDCDWLVWFLWKESCKISPRDPESVVTDLEVACADSGLGESTGFVEVAELWRVLGELGVRAYLTRAQFDAGVVHLLDNRSDKSGDKRVDKSSSQDSSLVDYEALCRYMVRMGRAFIELEQARRKVDEAKYEDMKKAFLAAMLIEENDPRAGMGKESERRSNSLKFERVFKRMDSNSDGAITVDEFRKGLKLLKYKGLRDWTQQMAWRFFEDIDCNSDGLLSLVEFSAFVRSSGQSSGPRSLKKSKMSARVEEEVDDDEDDLFIKTRMDVSDDKLFGKISVVLQDSVAPEGRQIKGDHAHMENIKSTVRKFFLRSDEERLGVVSESRFKVFCRNSGLSSRLNTSEMKLLLQRLSRKASNKVSSETLIDYERLCSRISVVEESIAHGKAEGVMLRLQDAAVESEGAGRPFLGLCSLSDHSLTGRMSEEEFIHTARMMGCALSAHDMLALRDLFPHCFVVAVAGKIHINYKEVNRLLEAYTPWGGDDRRETHAQELRLSTRLSRSGTPMTGYAASPYNLGSNSLRSPGGFFINTPQAPREPEIGYDDSQRFSMSLGTGRHKRGGTSAHDLVVWSLAEKVNKAVEDRTRVRGFPYSLSRQFAVYDRGDRGTVSMQVFQGTLDDLGVYMSAVDVSAVSGSLGIDGGVDYSAFCNVCAKEANIVEGRGQEEISRRPLDSTALQPAFLCQPRVAQRVVELQRSNRNPRDIFLAIDLDRSGLLSTKRFRGVVEDLELLQTEHQIGQCVSAFAHLGERNMVCYEDFCDVLERAANSYANTREGLIPPPKGRWSRDPGASADDLSLPNKDWGNSLLRDSFSSERKASRFESSGRSQRYDDNEEDEGLDLPSLRRGDFLGNTTRSRYDNEYSLSGRGVTGVSTPMSLSPPRQSLSRLEAPRSPPRRVGVGMWGNSTPLAKKGVVPRVDNRWCCPVCYYTENALDTDICEVCTSHNHDHDKSFQLRVKCPSCSFENGQFAYECEMCHKGLPGKK